VPKPGQDILFIEAKPDAEWPESIYAHWGPITHQPPTGATVNDWMGEFVSNITRYVTATVSVKFQGRSMTYRFIDLFGKGDQPVILGDVMVEATAYSQFKQSFIPDRLLHDNGRENPVVRNWMRSHTVDDPSCKPDELCCVENKCGLRSVDLGRKLGEPIRSSPASSQPFLAPSVAAKSITGTVEKSSAGRRPAIPVVPMRRSGLPSASPSIAPR
jgi:hypothetical protein